MTSNHTPSAAHAGCAYTCYSMQVHRSEGLPVILLDSSPLIVRSEPAHKTQAQVGMRGMTVHALAFAATLCLILVAVTPMSSDDLTAETCNTVRKCIL